MIPLNRKICKDFALLIRQFNPGSTQITFFVGSTNRKNCGNYRIIMPEISVQEIIFGLMALSGCFLAPDCLASFRVENHWAISSNSFFVRGPVYTIIGPFMSASVSISLSADIFFVAVFIYVNL